MHGDTGPKAHLFIRDIQYGKKSQVSLSFHFLCISDHVRSPRPQSVAALCGDLLDVWSSN